MPNISYIHNGGTLYAKWPGKSVREGGKIKKVGQIYLGKVHDIDKNIFWTKERGFYTIDPETQTFGEPDPAFIPATSTQPDNRRRVAPVIVDFGDACFRDQFVRSIDSKESAEILRASFLWYALLNLPSPASSCNTRRR